MYLHYILHVYYYWFSCFDPSGQGAGYDGGDLLDDALRRRLQEHCLFMCVTIYIYIYIYIYIL